MRLTRVSTVFLLAFLLLVLGYPATAGATSSAWSRTYTVLVGAENAHRGIDVMAFFPSSVKIHVGDTIRWAQNSNEIHTVTFLGGSQPPTLLVPAASLGLPPSPPPPSPLVFNPLAVNRAAPSGGLADTTTFVNSGLMGREDGQYRLLRAHLHGRGHVPLPLPGARHDDVGHGDGRRPHARVASPVG